MAPSLQYERGLKKLLFRLNPHFKLTKEALTLASDLCNDLNEKLIDKCRTNFKAAKKIKTTKRIARQLTEEHVQNAVIQLFKSNVRTHALTEGHKTVALFQSNVLQFDANQALEHETIEKPELTPVEIFSRSLVKLNKTLYEPFNLTIKGKTYLAKILLNIVNNLVTNAVNNARDSDSLDLQNVVQAARQYFIVNFFNHAHAQGARLVALYVDGLVEFDDQMLNESRRGTSEEERTESWIAIAEDWQNQRKEMFSRGIRELCTTNGSIQQYMRKEAVTRVDCILSFLAARVALEAVKNAFINGDTTLDVNHINRAVCESFSYDLAKNAAAHAFKISSLYAHGIVDFDPKPSARQLAAMKEAKHKEIKEKIKHEETQKTEKLHAAKIAQPTVPNLKSSLKTLLQEIHVAGTMDKEATELLNTVLVDLLKRVAQEVITNPTRGLTGQMEIGSSEVFKTVFGSFNGNLKLHALSNGLKMLYSSEKYAALNSLVKLDDFQAFQEDIIRKQEEDFSYNFNGADEMLNGLNNPGFLDRSFVEPYVFPNAFNAEVSDPGAGSSHTEERNMEGIEESSISSEEHAIIPAQDPSVSVAQQEEAQSAQDETNAQDRSQQDDSQEKTETSNTDQEGNK